MGPHHIPTITGLAAGDHLCCLYETEEEHRAVLTPFLRRGLEKGEKVVYVVDARSSKAILGYLRRDRLKVDSYLASGQLSFLNVDQAYLRGGVFDPNRMINLMRAETKRALAEGYAALRVTGEMSWAVRRRAGLERLVEYESKLAAFFPGSKCLALCQYDRRRSSPELLLNVLATHPIAVVGTEMCENFYYVPPRRLTGPNAVDHTVRRWLENLTSRKRAEEAVHRTHMELEERVQERTAELEEVNAGLRVEVTKRKQMAEALRESEDRYRDLVEHSRDLICTHDLEGRILSFNALPARIMGYAPGELLGKNVRELLAEGARDRFDEYLTAIRRNGSAGGLMRVRTKSGEVRIWEYHNTLRTEGVDVPTVRGVAHDVTERVSAERLLKQRVRQQAAIAELGSRALEGDELPALMSDAVGIVAKTLELEYCHVMELLGDGTGLLMRAGVGWKEGSVGHATVGVGGDSQAGYTLLSGEPVIVEDLRGERRFRIPPLLHEHGLASGMTVIIRGRLQPFGVMGAFSTGRRSFTKDDLHYLCSVANMLAMTIERKRAEAALRSREQELSEFVENARVPIHWVGPDGRILWANRAELELLGYSREKYVGSHICQHHSDRKVCDDILARLLRSEEVHDYEAKLRCKDGSFREVLISSSAYCEGDRFIHSRCFTRDITESKRAKETADALYQASLQIQGPLGLAQRLERLLETAQSILHLDRVNLFLSDSDQQWLQAVASTETEQSLESIRIPIGRAGGGVALAYLTGQPIVWEGRGPVPEELRLQPPYDRVVALRSLAFVNVPLVVEGKTIGVMGADRKHTRRPLDAGLISLLQLFAAQAAVAIQNSRLFEEVRSGRERLKSLSQRLMEVQEVERRTLARELHDEVGQSLTAVKINLEAVRRVVRVTPFARRLEESIGMVERILDQVRTLSLDLRPSMLDDLGLVAALRWYTDRHCRRAGLTLSFTADAVEIRLPGAIEVACFRIAQEALTNVVRHARARHVSVDVRFVDRKIHLLVCDDGVGFDVAAAYDDVRQGQSAGLLGMRERAALFGGQLEIDAAPTRGTRVRVDFSLPPLDDGHGSNQG